MLFFFIATALSTRWNKTGITIAGITGSPGVAANRFAHPHCLVLGPSNVVYVTDQPNNRVQKWIINATTGSTVAGQSSGVLGSTLNQLCYPSDLAVDVSGNLYIVDGGNHRVVYWPNGASSGTMVAGTGTKSQHCFSFLLLFFRLSYEYACRL